HHTGLLGMAAVKGPDRDHEHEPTPTSFMRPHPLYAQLIHERLHISGEPKREAQNAPKGDMLRRSSAAVATSREGRRRQYQHGALWITCTTQRFHQSVK